MNEQIKELKLQAQLFALEKCNGLSHDSSYVPLIDILMDKFAELIVKECTDAADMAYDARCEHPGDYVGEQLGYGKEHGITAWRIGVEK